MEWKSWHLWEGFGIYHKTRGWEPSWAKCILPPESQTQAGLPMFYLSLTYTRASFLSFSLKISSVCLSDTGSRKPWLPSYTLQLPAPAPRPASQGSSVTHRLELGIHLCVKKPQHDGNEDTTQPWDGDKGSRLKRGIVVSGGAIRRCVCLTCEPLTIQWRRPTETQQYTPMWVAYVIFPAGALQE